MNLHLEAINIVIQVVSGVTSQLSHNLLNYIKIALYTLGL